MGSLAFQVHMLDSHTFNQSVIALPIFASLPTRRDPVSNPSKREHYEHLIDHLDKAHELGFHFEAAWLEYVIIEDRLSSAIRIIGGTPPLMLGKKIGALEDALPDHRPLRQAFFGDLLDRIDAWKGNSGDRGRNYLMHQMADEAMPPEELHALCADLSERGAVLVRDVCSAVARLKKRM